MPEYLAPGVYVEEVDTGSKPIEGVSTSTSGMVGVTERGPENVATLVTSFADFQQQFGGRLNYREFSDSWYLPHAVEGFFTNLGKRVYVVRVLPAAATYAATTLFDRGLSGGVSSALAAPSRANDTGLILIDRTGVTNGMWLRIGDGAATEYVQVDPNGLNAQVMALRGAYAFNHPVGAAVRVHAETVDATLPAPPRTLAADAAPNDMSLTLNDRSGLAAGDVLRIGAGAQREFVIIDDPAPAAANSVTLSYPVQFPHVGIGGGAEAVVRMDLSAAPAASSFLIASGASGDGLLVLENGAGFNPDALIEVAGATAAQTEYRTIEDLLTVRLRAGDRLDFYHRPSGTTVQVVTITDVAPARTLVGAHAVGGTTVSLNDVQGLAQGEIVRIGASGDADREYVIVESINSAQNQIDVRYPLVLPHADGLSASKVTVAPAANGTTMLAGHGYPGQDSLLLTNIGQPNAFANDVVIEVVGGVPEETEYHVVGTMPTAGAILLQSPASGLKLAHTTGASVDERSPALRVQAIDRGLWGNCLRVQAEDELQEPLVKTRTAADAAPGAANVRLASTVGVEKGTILGFWSADGTTSLHHQKVTDISGNQVQFGPGGISAPATIPAGSQVRSLEFKLTVECVQENPLTRQSRVVRSETHRHLSMDPRHSRYAVKVVGSLPNGVPKRPDGRTEGEADLIRVQDLRSQAQAQSAQLAGPDLIWETLPDGRRRIAGRRLMDGDDAIGSLADDDYIGQDAVNPQDRTGLFALKNIEEVSIVAIPGRTKQPVQEAVINHCELMRYRCAVLDSRQDDGIAEVQEQRGLYDTKYGALYYPWLAIPDPFPENPQARGTVLIPPSGHIMGIYARSDIERGVHKAPANETIRGIFDLEVKLTKEQQDILNPRNINALRNFREQNRGLRVWGARVLSSDPDWKYVNVRRLFIFVEHSIDRGTQWVVFEPNNEELWARVRRVISAFLTNVWRDGALMGTTPEEAYYVKCDRTTMTQNDIDNGRLIVQVGLAVTKPAEFVIFRIGQWAGGSSLEEGT